jgi:hypothetical protein
LQLVVAQGFFEGNKRTAVIIARWFIRENTDIDPDELIRPDDRELGGLLVRTARGERIEAEIRALLHRRIGTELD